MYGAGPTLFLRVTLGQKTTWQVSDTTRRQYRTPVVNDDILEVKLLQQYQTLSHECQKVVTRRDDGTVELHTFFFGDNGFEADGRLPHVKIIHRSSIYAIDINNSLDPLLLSGGRGERFYFTHIDDDLATDSPDKSLTYEFDRSGESQHRKRDCRFISPHTFALALYFPPTFQSPIHIFDINDNAQSRKPTITLHAYSRELTASNNAANPNVVKPLISASSSDSTRSDLLLSGWSSGRIHLHDIRAGSLPILTLADPVDDGQVLSLLPIGAERILAGSDQNGCLKAFDLRNPDHALSDNIYEYDLGRNFHYKGDRGKGSESQKREINTFLSVPVPTKYRSMQQRIRREVPTEIYKGSIYSLASPSASSPTVYAGIEGSILQLDYVCSDDIRRGHLAALSAGVEQLVKQCNEPRSGEAWESDVLSVSCYERPRVGKEMTDSILLRKQVPWSDLSGETEGTTALEHREEGWDERWRLASYDRPKKVDQEQLANVFGARKGEDLRPIPNRTRGRGRVRRGR